MSLISHYVDGYEPEGREFESLRAHSLRGTFLTRGFAFGAISTFSTAIQPHPSAFAVRSGGT
jgi:hypothetical protein